jgi:6-pyruvoyltetrahydropterin/6-carboxytetrahydropterin synthase
MDGKVTFHRTFSAAHRLWSDSSKCSNIHGHNYRVSVGIVGRIGEESRMVVPFEWVKDVIDNFDHALLLHVRDPQLHELGNMTRVVITDELPTTETVAQQIAQEIADMLSVDDTIREVNVTLAETDNIVAFGYAASVPHQ